MSTTTDTDRLAALQELVEGSTLVATILQAPMDSNGNTLRAAIVHRIPDTDEGRTPYPVPVAAASGHFMDGVQLVAFALLSQVTGEYPGTDTIEEHRTVRDGVSILPHHYTRTQREVTEAAEHAGRAIAEREREV